MASKANTGHWLADQIVADTNKRAGSFHMSSLSTSAQLDLYRATLCTRMCSQTPGKELSWDDCRDAHVALINAVEA